uniref:RRM domain-containing protein n=1 Tax=Leptobrachium leishanense TaxID=445787 RepID=A0A8C5M3E4_9ANUR
EHASRFEPYKSQKRYQAFISNIPFDVKWQSLKDLVKEKVGEVTYVELLMDDEGKSRVMAFKLEESVKKAVQLLNEHVLSGRPLKVKEDPHGEPMGMSGPISMGGTGPLWTGHAPSTANMNIPASILNNPNIPVDVIHALQSGRLGSTVFVANLDYTVGWKKLKEVFGIAGSVLRADILEDKDGNSRGIATVTYEQAIEAVQAILEGPVLNLGAPQQRQAAGRRYYITYDHFVIVNVSLLGGLGGIGLGLGPGGQPLDTGHLRSSGGKWRAMECGISRSVGLEGGMRHLLNIKKMGKFTFLNISEQKFLCIFLIISYINFASLLSIKCFYKKKLTPFATERFWLVPFKALFFFSHPGSGVSSLGSTLERLSSSIASLPMAKGVSDLDRLGLILDRMVPNSDRINFGMGTSIGMGISKFDRLVGSGLDAVNSGLGYSTDRMDSTIDSSSSSRDRMGSSLDHVGSGMDRVGFGIERLGSSSLDRMGPGLDRVGPGMDRLPPVDCLSASSFGRVGLDCIGSSSLDRLGTGLGMGSNMGLGMSTRFDWPLDIEHNKFGRNVFGGAASACSGAVPRKGCQIFVRNVSVLAYVLNLEWHTPFSHCWCHVVYADVKMENGKSKGCGVVKFETPEAAERACRMMNGIKLGGREVDVRIDRNA